MHLPARPRSRRSRGRAGRERSARGAQHPPDGRDAARGERLELVIRAGAGTNTIDTGAASALGVSVCNVPGKNAVAVAELTLGLMIALDRRIADNVRRPARRALGQEALLAARGLLGARLGIVGLGAIGMAVAERAHASGCGVATIGKQRSAAVEARRVALGITYVPSIEALAAESDILTFHLPAIPESKGLLGEKLLRHVRHGAIILNTSRGDLVDEAPCSPRSRRRTSGWGWTSTRTSRRADARPSRARSRGIPTCTAPTTSAPPPTRPSPRSPTAWWRSWKLTGAVKCATA